MNHLPSILLAFFTLALSLEAQKPAEPKQPAAPAPGKSAPGQPKAVTPDEAAKVIGGRKDVTVIDLRTEEEFDMGHIPGAKNVSSISPDFPEKMKEFEGKPILIHCGSGPRSTRALKQLVGKYPEIFHMDGGIKAWTESGKELVKTVVIPDASAAPKAPATPAAPK
jgi:rhodanese-related sulfurtransferase